MPVWAQVMAYRTDVIKTAPVGWADFWDIKKFRGDRALLGAGSGNSPELEFAVMAAGLPREKVSPIDMDKAFASYDTIKDSVVKWWETGAVPMQLLTDREVVATSVWNGRMAALQAAGAPATISWPQGLLKRDCWSVPKGAKNAGNAMKFIAFSTMTIPQARLSMLIPYGFVNNKSPQYLSAERMSILPARRPSSRSCLPTTISGGWTTAMPWSRGSTNGCWDDGMDGSGLIDTSLGPATATAQGATVTLVGLEKSFDHVGAVRGVSLDIRSGEFLTLLAPWSIRRWRWCDFPVTAAAIPDSYRADSPMPSRKAALRKTASPSR